MKPSIKAKKNHVGPKPAPQLPQPASRFSRWRLGVLALVLLVTGGGTWAIMEYVVWNVLPSELVGSWKVVRGPDAYKEAVFDFHRSGKMIGHLNRNDNLEIMKADVRVEADKLFITTRHPSSGAEHVSVQTISTLNERHLVVVDEAGRDIKMARIR